ncbi:hypothetical protein EWI07_06505 [Sporolactobacillus sp. THM7-4]|nr:hypothetical protein EWI07_06505 [Sporolactobacillus sp. THM7-4]
MDITFESKQEAAEFYRRLPSSFRQAVKLLLINNRLALFPDNKPACQECARFIARFIMDKYEKKWLMEIIEKHYLFTDAEEKISILNIVSAIFAGEKNDIPQTDGLPDRRQLIIDSLEGILNEHSTLSFQSILRFRLNAYREALRRFVEIAIDEYKLEQEYQVFIDKLRRIIRAYKPLCERIEVFDGSPFKLFDDRHRLIRNVQSVRSFYPLLKQWGIEAEPSIILTLIALAPKQVIVYTDRPEDGVMKTLHRVFEDRVCFLPGSFSARDEAGFSEYLQ